MRTIIAAAALAALSVAAYAETSALDGLKPHRAVYDVTLSDASERSGIKGSRGRIVYEMTGSACEGFATQFRFFQQVRTARREYTSDQRTTTFEDTDGESFSFVNRSFFNGSQEKEVRGKATRGTDGLRVAMEKPDEAALDLPKAVFTTQHVAQIIEAARDGETIVTADVFDGSGDADEVMQTTAIIGRRRDEVAVGEGEDDAAARSVTAPWWPVSIAYFKRDGENDAGERLPVYQVSFALHASGVSRDLVMRYEDYSLRGTLREIEFLEQEPCD